MQPEGARLLPAGMALGQRVGAVVPGIVSCRKVVGEAQENPEHKETNGDMHPQRWSGGQAAHLDPCETAGAKDDTQPPGTMVLHPCALS